MPPSVSALTEALHAHPGDWPRASPNAETAIEVFYHVLQLCQAGDVPKVKEFSEKGGVRAVVQMLQETADESDRKAEKVAAAEKMEMNKDVQHLLMLADLHTLGMGLLNALGGVAEDGEGTTLAELKASKAMVIAVRSTALYPDNPDHAESGLAALSTLQPLDPDGFLEAKAPDVILRTMKNKPSPWLLYLGARTLARFSSEGGAKAVDALKAAGALEALKMACGAPPGDASCGAEWGVKDVSAKLQVFARTCIANLVGFPHFSFGGRASSMLALNLFLLQVRHLRVLDLLLGPSAFGGHLEQVAASTFRFYSKQRGISKRKRMR